MNLKIKHFVAFITIVSFVSCNQAPQELSKINANQINVDSTFASDEAIQNFITPYQNRVNEVLDSTLTYAPFTLTKTDGELNTSAGNLMADVILSEANPIFKSRTNKNIDFSLVNHGGVRSIISKGNVSARNAYEIMPFENSIVVVELTPESVLEMVDFLIRSKRAHPISGMQIIVDKNNELHTLNIQGKPFSKTQNYYVATSNYLVKGGDNMGFFKNKISVTDTDYLIRTAMIDYFKKVDTLKVKVDDRFYQLK